MLILFTECNEITVLAQRTVMFAGLMHSQRLSSVVAPKEYRTERMESRPKKALSTLKRMLGFVVLFGVIFLAWSWRDIPGDWLAYRRGERPLTGVRSWHLQLQKVDVAEMSRLDADMLVTNYADERTNIPLTGTPLRQP